MLTSESALRKDRTNASGPTLEHRHFAVIAEIIRAMDEPNALQGLWANHFADQLANTNPRFDRARFLKACGVEL